MAPALIAACLLIVATTLVHYECLRGMSAILTGPNLSGRLRVLAAVFGTFVAHILEIAIYAVAYGLLRDHFGLGNFRGHFVDTWSTLLYFSAETYTSVGFGDIVPTGALRLLCGFEALNGLLLIGWSASFAYVYMGQFWPLGNGRS